MKITLFIFCFAMAVLGLMGAIGDQNGRTRATFAGLCALGTLVMLYLAAS